MYKLTDLGYDSFFEKQAEGTGFAVGRVSTSANGMYSILSDSGMFSSRVSGRFFHNAAEARDFPSVGDWVLFEPIPDEQKGIIHLVMDRKSLLSRKMAGDSQKEQLMAANVDFVFLVNALNKDFNLRRMERYLMQVYESGATPVFILTKRDVAEEVEEKIAAVEEIAFGVPVLAVDTFNGSDIDKVRKWLKPGKTISLIGSSGVGKSTLINQILGKVVQKTQGIREDDSRGRHTTTRRELFLLPSGGVVIDTPGMREVQLWSGEAAANETFQDIETLSTQCKFRDCRHDQEPGCAIKQAIQTGVLTAERFKSYRKLEREAKFLDLKARHGSNRASRIQVQELMKGTW